jgi:hypothetical protein
MTSDTPEQGTKAVNITEMFGNAVRNSGHDLNDYECEFLRGFVFAQALKDASFFDLEHEAMLTIVSGAVEDGLAVVLMERHMQHLQGEEIH